MNTHFAIILAAGASSRMGEPKCCLPWLSNEPLLSWMSARLEETGWDPVSVVRPETYKVWKKKLGKVVLNPTPELGKAESIALGARQIPRTARWILISAVDQPRPASVYRQLHAATEKSTSRILVHDYEGHRGHPIVVSAELLPEIVKTRDEELGLRGIMDRNRALTQMLPPMRPEIPQWDMNTREAYLAAKAWFEENSAAK